MPRPDVWKNIVGSSLVKSTHAVVLAVGNERFDKYTMVQELRCAGTYRAARLLTARLKELGVTTVHGAKEMTPERLARRGIGPTTLYVFMCWQQRKMQNAQEWYNRYYDYTFNTLKHRMIKAEVK